MSKTTVEIRLFNHENNKVIYKKLTEDELKKISEILNVNMNVMLKDEFKFKLHSSMWTEPGDSEFIFHAKAWNDKSYYVTFEKDGKEECVGYWKEEVEKHVSNDKWIVID